MMKHVGKIKDTQEKIVVLWNEVPNEPDKCLVVKTASLNEIDHDELIAAVESDEGQASTALAEALHHRMNRAGRPVLMSLHRSGKIIKLSTDDVILTPNAATESSLRAVNDIMRGQNRSRGLPDNPPAVAPPQALSDEDIAEDLIRQADQMQAESRNLRKQAYEMNPSLKPKRAARKKAA